MVRKRKVTCRFGSTTSSKPFSTTVAAWASCKVTNSHVLWILVTFESRKHHSSACQCQGANSYQETEDESRRRADFFIFHLLQGARWGPNTDLCAARWGWWCFLQQLSTVQGAMLIPELTGHIARPPGPPGSCAVRQHARAPAQAPAHALGSEESMADRVLLPALD